MDITEARGYFDEQVFDVYDFAHSTWTPKVFKAKLDLANPKISLMNKGTRRRMMFSSPGQEPPGAVIRAPTGDIFLIGQQSKDVFRGVYYRDVTALHYALGAASVNRRAPAGPSNNPGWAVPSLIENTFADYELRSDNENQQDQITQWGFFSITLPYNSAVQEHDTVTVAGRTFFVFEVYTDSGMIACRSTDRPDDRFNTVYKSYLGNNYDPAQTKAVPTYADSNVTMQLQPYVDQQDVNSTVTKVRIKAMVKTTWIGVVPKLLDKIVYNGLTYIVERVAQNMLQDEWHLVAGV